MAADLDGDRDLDVIAVARVPNAADDTASKLASVVWLEQRTPGEFRRHTLEMGSATHATMDAGDFDLDGDIDRRRELRESRRRAGFLGGDLGEQDEIGEENW